MSAVRIWLGATLCTCIAACSPALLPELPQPDWNDAAPVVRVELDAAYARVQSAPRDAAAAGDFGLLMQAYHQLDAAEISYRRAALLAPDAARWPYLRGTVLAELGRSAEAAGELRRAIGLDPRAMQPRLRLADVLVHSGDDYAARVLYEQILRSDVGNPHAHYALGALLLGGGDAPRGSSPPLDPDLRSRLDALAQSDRPYIVEGVKLAYAGRVDEAIRAYETALTRVPDNPDSHVTLIGLYGARHDLVQAEAHFRAAVALAPDAPKAWFNVGFARLEAGRLQESMSALLRARDLAPQDAETRALLGQAYERTGNTDDALEQYREAMAIDPEHAHARYLLVHVLIALGRYAEAFAAEAQPGSGDAKWTTATLRELAAAHAQRGDLEQCFALLERASTLAGNDPALVAAVNSDLHRYRAQAGAE